MDTARRLLDQAHHLTTAAGIIKETHQLLNQLQSTAERLAAAEPSDEFVRALAWYHSSTSRYCAFLSRSAGQQYSIAGPPMPQYRLAGTKDIKPRAVPTPGYALLPQQE